MYKFLVLWLDDCGTMLQSVAHVRKKVITANVNRNDKLSTEEENYFSHHHLLWMMDVNYSHLLGEYDKDNDGKINMNQYSTKGKLDTCTWNGKRVFILVHVVGR